MAQEITFTKQADGTWQGSFTSTGTRTIVQVEREENAPLYLNISADNGQHNVIYQPPKPAKDQILSIDIAEGALVTIVSHSAVTKAQYIASALDYYTKDEIDDKMEQIHQFEPVVASSLPTASANTMYKFYFIPKQYAGEQTNTKEEWMTVKEGSSYRWEKIGETDIDLNLNRAAIVLLPSGSTSAQRTDAEQQIRALGYTHGILYDANGYISYNGTSKKFEYNNSVVQWSKQLDSNDSFMAFLSQTGNYIYQFTVADSGLSGKIEWDFDKYAYINNGTQAEPDYTLVPFDVHTADEHICAEMFGIMVDDPTNTPAPVKAVIEMLNEGETSMWGYTLFVNRDAVIRDAHEVATIPATLSWDSNNNEYILECDYTPKEVAEIMRQDANRGIPVVMHVMCERRTDTETDIDYPTGSMTYQWTQEYDVPLECTNMHRYDNAQTNENYYAIHGVVPVANKYLIGLSDDDADEKYLGISGTWESEGGLAYGWVAEFLDRPWCERPNSLQISTSSPENSAVTVDFPKRTRRYHEVYANSNFTINITAKNSAENYVRVFNTSNSEISVTIGTVSYYDTAIAAANIITVQGGISIAAGTSAEISAIVFSDQAIISCKGNVNPKELPTVTSSDNGKILLVYNGAWTAAEVPVADSVLYPNSNN